MDFFSRVSLFFVHAGSVGPLVLFGELFWPWGFFAMLWAGLQFAPRLWLLHIRLAWEHHQEFLLLQIDVPKANEQGPLAVENIFSHLAGAHSTFSFYENWWVGRCQLPLSLEIISVGGYIKFIIRTPVKYRDLVEASVYSQYPDAQITEVQDYVGSVPKQYPNPTHLLWGAEWVPVNHEVYPIRTYKEFEDKLSGEFKDPL